MRSLLFSDKPLKPNRPGLIECDFCGAKYEMDRKFVLGLARYTCAKCIDPALKGRLCLFGSPESNHMSFACSSCGFQNDGKRRFVPEKVSVICSECVAVASERIASTEP